MNSDPAMGQFAPAAGEEGSTAVHVDSNIFKRWGTNVQIKRGLMDISDSSLSINGSNKASYGEENDALGKADGAVVSLGDGGEALFFFEEPLRDNEGADFAVFENSFDGRFLELAFVEVSSDGSHFFRFPAISLTQDTAQIEAFGELDPQKIHNLAGKYQRLYGTPFDFADLPDTALLDKNAVSYIKIVDVIGSIDSNYASYDSSGNIINDPWPTRYETSGFDLDAIGVMDASGTPIIDNKMEKIDFRVRPNPFNSFIEVSFSFAPGTLRIYNSKGHLMLESKIEAGNNRIETSFMPGIYFVLMTDDHGHIHQKKMICR